MSPLLELFYTCVANLAKIMNQREITIPEEQCHYIEKDDYNRCIYHKRELDATERTIVVMHDAEKLIALCDKTGELDDASEYQLLICLLKERQSLMMEPDVFEKKKKLKIHLKFY